MNDGAMTFDEFVADYSSDDINQCRKNVESIKADVATLRQQLTQAENQLFYARRQYIDNVAVLAAEVGVKLTNVPSPSNG